VRYQHLHAAVELFQIPFAYVLDLFCDVLEIGPIEPACAQQIRSATGTLEEIFVVETRLIRCGFFKL
jgi:hypothetical protein